MGVSALRCKMHCRAKPQPCAKPRGWPRSHVEINGALFTLRPKPGSEPCSPSPKPSDRARSPGAVTDDTRQAVAALLAHEGSVLLVAEQYHHIVGSLIVGWDGWRGNMYRLAVVPHLRRQGIARRLVDEAHQHLRQVGARCVTALVAHEEQEATGLWRSGGYEVRREDLAVRCVGLNQSTETAINIARPGGAVGRVGVPQDPMMPGSQTSFYKNVTVGGGPAPRKHDCERSFA